MFDLLSFRLGTYCTWDSWSLGVGCESPCQPKKYLVGTPAFCYFGRHLSMRKVALVLVHHRVVFEHYELLWPDVGNVLATFLLQLFRNRLSNMQTHINTPKKWCLIVFCLLLQLYNCLFVPLPNISALTSCFVFLTRHSMKWNKKILTLHGC